MARSLQAVSLPEDLEAANVLIAGRYRVLSRLGKGGAGSVYRVQELGSGQELALKRLSARAGKQLHALFEREYYTLSTLKHPNVVEVFEYGSDANGPYYTMELLSGSDLSDHAPMPWQRACQVLIEAASALAPLHARRLIHRDVGPRNLWRTPEGNIKLIDFGALTPFGTPGDVVGTAPFVAPEALHGQPLDQRTDLYALGALLYWLLTGLHAFPARALRDLPNLWSAPFVPASRRLEALNRADLPTLPAELDALVEALLSRDPKARPSSTGDVTDRVRAIAGLLRDARPERAQLFLQQGAFVGREREQRHFQRRMQLATGGNGGCTVIEARSGEGRTRMLAELAAHARVAGAAVIRVDAGLCDGVHGVASALALKLLDSFPEQARATITPHAGTLGHMSPKLAECLSESALTPMPTVAGEARARLHEALVEWVCELSKQQQLVILIDDLQRADEASVAALFSLSLAAERQNLMIVVAYNSDTKNEASPSLKSLLQQGRRVLLRPLDGSAARELLSSLFGEVPHLVRLAERLHRASRGNPAHLLELAQHLVRQELITCVDGTWVLPTDVPDELLSFSRLDALVSRLDNLSDMGRVAARILSVRQGMLSLPMCLALTDLEAKDLYPALSGLVAEGVLIGADEGYRFADEPTRLALYAELTPASQRSARGRLGKLLLAHEKLTRLEELEAHSLLLDHDESGKSAARMCELAQTILLQEPDNMPPAAPLIEKAYQHFRENGRSSYEQVRLIAALAVAGYFSDRKLLARYAEPAVRTLGSLLKVPLMQRLTPFLGLKLSFYIGMFLAAFGFRKHKQNRCVPTLKETTMLFLNLLTSLAGASTIQIDPFTAKRYAEMVRPWTALGPKSPALLPYRIISCLALTTSDHIGRAAASWKPLVAALRDPAKCPGVPEPTRLRFLGGALYASGVAQCWHDGPEALRIAEELENFPIKFYRMSADQLRTIYYANQGNLALFEHYRRRSELHAIQRGSAWQVELWTPSASITAHMRTADAHAMKQSIEQAQRLVKTVPSLSILIERARGAYLLLRRHYTEAVPVLERVLSEPAAAVVGWARAHGALARALNALGMHERALEVCMRAMAELTPEDLRFPAMNLGLQIELALAHAGLGQREQAVAELEALIKEHAPNNGPLTLGALHEARARVALWMADEATCREHLVAMEKWYRGTDVPTLIARSETFAKEVKRHFTRERDSDSLTLDGSYVAPTSTSNGTTSITLVERELTQATSLPDFAARALRVLTEGMPEPSASLWVLNGQQLDLQASLNDREPPAEVVAWVLERCAAVMADDVTQTAIVDDVAIGNPDLLLHQGVTYHLSFLRGGYADQDVGGVVITGSTDANARPPSAYMVETVGKRLKHQLKTQHTSIGTIH